MYGLALGEFHDIGWALFSGKGAYLEPGLIDPVGNHEFVVYVEDGDKPDTGTDKFWLEMKDIKGVLIPAMSMDRNASDNAEPITGGNIVVPH